MCTQLHTDCTQRLAVTDLGTVQKDGQTGAQIVKEEQDKQACGSTDRPTAHTTYTVQARCVFHTDEHAQDETLTDMAAWRLFHFQMVFQECFYSVFQESYHLADLNGKRSTPFRRYLASSPVFCAPPTQPHLYSLPRCYKLPLRICWGLSIGK